MASQLQWTRAQYMAHECTRQQYYFQFGVHLMRIVPLIIGRERINNSKDEHFNDIPLIDWEELEPFVLAIVGEAMREADPGGIAMADCVCAAKSAAQVLRDLG